jgi:hypothetical protein
MTIKLKYITLCLALLGTITTQAQRIITGTVQDETAQSLPFAAVALLHDSVPLKTGQTEMDGLFQFSMQSETEYVLKVSYVGYEVYEKTINVSSLKDTLNIGIIKLRPLSKMLDEAVITAQRDPVQIKGDTTEFNASSFKTQPNAPAEELIKKLPGLEVEKDGSILAKGEPVRKILVNGKPFFGNDPKIALQNFPADAIESVQVFEKKSDQAEFTGIDNGEREMTINIIIKPSHNRRTSGKATAGVGTNSRYLGRGTFNKFTEVQKITVLGAANNINKTGFSEEDFLSFTNNGQSVNNNRPNNNVGKGFQEGQSGGINFIQNKTKNTDINASYFLSNQDVLNDRVLYRQNFLPTGNYTTRSNAVINTGTKNHRFSGYIDQKLDSLTSFRFTSSLNFNENTYKSNSFGQNFRQDTIRQTQTKKQSNTEGSGIGLNSNILLRRRLGKAGRTVSLNLGYNRNTGDRAVFTNAQTQFYDALTQLVRRNDTIFQNDSRNNNRNSYSGTLSYTEPLSKKFLGEINYRYSTIGNHAEREVFNLLKNESNLALSNFYNSAFLSHRAGSTLRFNQKGLTASAGVQGQRSILRGDFISTNQVVRQQFQYILPNARLEFNPSKTKRVNFSYETDVREPSIEQLQPVQDNSDPLNLFLGNADLQPEYANRIRLSFTNFNKTTYAYFNGNLNFTLTDNKIVNTLSVDTLLRRTYQPINVNGFADANGHLSAGWRFWQQRIRFNLTSNVSQAQGLSFVNGSENLTQRFNASLKSRLELRYQDTFELAFRAGVRYNQSKFSLQTNLNQTFWIYDYESDMTVGLPFDMRLNTIFEYSLYTATSFGKAQGIPIWNAAFSKYFNGRTFELRLSVIDILNRNTGINRTAEANYIQEETIRSLGRYGLLSLTCSFNKGKGKGKNKDKIKGERNNFD